MCVIYTNTLKTQFFVVMAPYTPLILLFLIVSSFAPWLASGQSPPGFLSIDVGSAETANYTDPTTGIVWTPDTILWPQIRSGRPPPSLVPRLTILPTKSNTSRSDTSKSLKNRQKSLALPSFVTPSLPKPTSTTWSVSPSGVAQTWHRPRPTSAGPWVSTSSLTATSGRGLTSCSRKQAHTWRSTMCKLSMGARRWACASQRSPKWVTPHLSIVSNCGL